MPTPDERLVVQEGLGRPKLVIAMPDLGGIIVVDAQWLLSQEPGSFADCKVDLWMPLKEPSRETLAQLAAQPVASPDPKNECGNPAPNTPPLKSSYTPRPGSISYSAGTLYVADLAAPVIHVIDMHDTLGHTDPQAPPQCSNDPILTPCNPIERPPLLPSSAETPARVVFASKVSVAPLPTPDLKRYLYATDVEDSSVMVFDVSPSSTTRRPLIRQHPEYNPFQPRDRVKFVAPPADVVVVQRDVPRIDPVTGIAKAGVLCNPDPNALVCIASSSSCDIGTAYRTTTDYTAGAGPVVLRGEFAFAALTDGKLGVIDIEDFDAPCRTPVASSVLAGCKSNSKAIIDSAGDVSCNTVQPFSARSGNFMAVSTSAGDHVPGLLTYPLLYNADGSSFTAGTTGTTPQMVATLPAAIPANCQQLCDPNQCGTTCDTLPGCPLQLFVGGVQTPVNLDDNGNACNVAPHCTTSADCPALVCDHSQKPAVCPDGTLCKKDADCGPACDPLLHVCTVGPTCTGTSCYTPGIIGQNGAPNNAVLMNLEDPRGQVADQDWTVSYEGAIPGFEQRLACLYVAGSTQPCVAGAPTIPPTRTLAGTLNDPNSRFCDAGVLGKRAFSAMLKGQCACGDGTCVPECGETEKTCPLDCGEHAPTLTSDGLADYVQLATDLLGPDDPYWTNAVSLAGTVYQPSCTYTECLASFGTLEQFPLNINRDMRIEEAYQDRLELVMRNDVPVECTPDGQPFLGQPCCSGAAFSASAGGAGTTTNLVCGACPASNPSGCVATTPSCTSKGCTRPLDISDLKCCFPGELNFTVRGGTQWMVVGDQSGFIHHVVADATSNGACRNACDPAAIRKNSRVIDTALAPGVVHDRSPSEIEPSPHFMNPMFRFAVTPGTACSTDADCRPGDGCNQGACNLREFDGKACVGGSGCPSTAQCDCTLQGCKGKCFAFSEVPLAAITPRDSVFRFSTNGSFSGMLLPLATDPTVFVNPQRVTFLPATGEVVVTDGSLNGVIFVSLQSATVSRSYF